MILYSCQGDKDDMDGQLAELPRTRNLTESLIAKYRVGKLWDKFGIVSDVVVSTEYTSPLIGLQLMCFRLIYAAIHK
jgi:hypothetical protein